MTAPPPVTAGRPRFLPADVADAAWLWLVLRVALGLIGVLLFVQRGAAPPCQMDLASNGWTTLPPLNDSGAAFPLVGVWQHNDACWYAKIAAHGYEAGQSSTAFFPLLPMLMRAGSILTGGNVALAGLLINAIALIVALTGLARLVRFEFDAGTAERAVLYLAVFPAAFFLLAPFSEPLFLASTVWAFVGARNRDWELATVAAFLAGLTRLHGILLVLPIAWEALTVLRDRRGSPDESRRSLSWRDLLPFGAAVAPLVAVAGYLAFTTFVVGQSFVDAQKLWGGANLRLPWELTAEAWDRVGTHGDAVTALNAGAFVLFIALAVVGLRHLPVGYSLYVLPSLALIVMRSPTFPFMSAMRYVSVLFPAFIVLALVGRSPRFHTGWLILSTTLLGYLVTLFFQGHFLG